MAQALADGAIPGAELAGVATRTGRVPAVGEGISVAQLGQSADLVVEAAGQTALAEHGVPILEAGCDLLAVSTGALADPDVFERFARATGGRLHICAGAIGGIDMVGAVRELGAIHDIHITTTKLPRALVQPGMSSVERDTILALAEPTVLFEGSSRSMATLFPTSTNVAATLALAAGSWDVVRGTVRADPGAELTSHVIEIDAEAGHYRFEMANRPSPDNSRSSAVVPWAVIRSLRDLCGRSWRFT